jgi:hypothetical protein
MDLRESISKKLGEVRRVCQECKTWNKDQGCESPDNCPSHISPQALIIMFEEILHQAEG